MPVFALGAARAFAFTAAFALSAVAAAATSSSFSITGVVTSPTRYDAARLATLPPITQTDTYLAGTTAQTHTYTGASLRSVLDGAGIVVGPGKNDLLNRYVLATATDGYKVVCSMGELSPDSGNRPDLVAYAETSNGVSTPLAADGFARVTAPGDVKGGRYVSNLVGLDVQASLSTRAGTGGGPSSRFTVAGGVPTPMSFDLAALQALPRITQTVGGLQYAGVGFWDLLTKTAGLSLDPNVKNDVLGKYVVATGSDGYKSVFSLGEIDPDLGNQPDLIAYAVDGAPLGANGFARLVVPGDVKAGRWVSNLVSLEVFAAMTPVPEPGSATMLGGGIGLLALYAVRRECSAARAVGLGVSH